ncbi:hypothetical protein [Bartonella sp. B1098]|uniref:hypothetical protein n=1 Tax=Bartonella sp. B1098 TaxID=2911421 RepID=UPI0020C2544E|nr:hypothetical protein [Bartonella sp. B1098]
MTALVNDMMIKFVSPIIFMLVKEKAGFFTLDKTASPSHTLPAFNVVTAFGT